MSANGPSLANTLCQRYAYVSNSIDTSAPITTSITSASANLCVLNPTNYTYVAKLAALLKCTASPMYELCDAENNFPYVIVTNGTASPILCVTSALVTFYNAPNAATTAMQLMQPANITQLQNAFQTPIAESATFRALLWPICFGPCARLQPPVETECPALYVSTLPNATTVLKFTTLRANTAIFSTKNAFISRDRGTYFWTFLASIFGPLDSTRTIVTTGDLDPTAMITNIDFLTQYLPGGTATKPTVQMSARTRALIHIDAAVTTNNISYIDKETAQFCLDNPNEIPLEIDMTPAVVQAILTYSRTELETTQLLWRYPQLIPLGTLPKFFNANGTGPTGPPTVTNTYVGHITAKQTLLGKRAYLFNVPTPQLPVLVTGAPVALNNAAIAAATAALELYGEAAFSHPDLQPVIQWFLTNYTFVEPFIANQQPESVNIVATIFSYKPINFAYIIMTLCAREVSDNVDGYIAAYYYLRASVAGNNYEKLADFYADPAALYSALGNNAVLVDKIMGPSTYENWVASDDDAIAREIMIENLTTARQMYLRNLELYITKSATSIYSLPGILEDQLYASETFLLRAGRRVRNRWITLQYGQSLENFNDYVYSVASAEGHVPKNLRVLRFTECVQVNGKFVKSISTDSINAALIPCSVGASIVQTFSVETTAILTRTGVISKAANIAATPPTPAVITWKSLSIGARTFTPYVELAGPDAATAVHTMSIGGVQVTPMSYTLVELDAGTALVDGGGLRIGFADCVMKKICEAGLTTVLALVIKRYFSGNKVIFNYGNVIFEICERRASAVANMRMACLVDGYYAAWAAILDAGGGPATLAELNFIAMNDLVVPIKTYYEISGSVPSNIAEKAIVYGAQNLYEFLAPLTTVANPITAIPADRQDAFAGGTYTCNPIPAKLLDFQQSLASMDPGGIRSIRFKFVGDQTIGEMEVTDYSNVTNGQTGSDITDYLTVQPPATVTGTKGEYEAIYRPYVSALKSQYSVFI